LCPGQGNNGPTCAHLKGGNVNDIPQRCERAGCQAPVQTFCPLCCRCFCTEHDKLPDGHICLASYGFFNATRRLDDEDEIEAALEHFRPVP
jgi:hypothetical protein